MSNSDSPTPIPPEAIERAAGAALAPIAKLGAAAAGLAAISYLIGAVYTRAYLSQIGAPWAIDLLSYAQVAKSGAIVSIPACILALASLVDMTRTGASPQGLQKWAFYSVLLGLIPMAVTLLPGSIISARSGSLCMLIAALLLTSSGGFTLAELIGRFWRSGYKWTSHHLQLVFTLQSLLLMTTPYMFGYAMAKLDLEGQFLPIVTGPELDEGGPWTLIRSLDNGLLIVAPAPASSTRERTFRVVPADGNINIASTSRRDT